MTNYQMYNCCVMDIKATDIVFDVDGVCHYCIMFLKMMEEAKAKIIDPPTPSQ